jgi:hypothetical protein
VIPAVLEVVDDPTLTLRATGPAGEPLWAQLFSGRCRIGTAEGSFKAWMSPSYRSTPLGFYVPRAGPFRPSHLLTAWGEVALASAQIRIGNGRSQRGPYGVDAPRVELVEGDEGLGSQWPYLSFDVLGGRPMVLRYRVTVTQPAD